MAEQPLNAFCVDLEEWFHVCGVSTPYADPRTWNEAPSHVVADTETLLRLLDEAGVHGTFLVVGWIAERHPGLVRRLVEAGHEVGCHGYWHRLLEDQGPDEFREDLARALALLRELSGQPVTTYRAPGFSLTGDCLWAYPILIELGILVDVSVVPARRDHGGIETFPRDPFLLHAGASSIKVFPVSVLRALGRNVPFSGGGYLRLFPMALVHHGFRQNHRAGRPGMSYIHPREVNPDQPRLPLPLLKGFKYYVGVRGTERKLRSLLATYRFTTVAEVMDAAGHLAEYRLDEGRLLPA